MGKERIGSVLMDKFWEPARKLAHPSDIRCPHQHMRNAILIQVFLCIRGGSLKRTQ